MKKINQNRFDMIKQNLDQVYENDELVIEENTIYEIDLECFNCLKEKEEKGE